VLGADTEIADRDPNAPPRRRHADFVTPQAGDRFIDHPTDQWVRTNLPEELRQTAYRLPADCADVAVILRHVWLFAHRRSEVYNGRWRVGFVEHESASARQRRVHRVISAIYSGNVATMVNPYARSDGRPERSFANLRNLLHPGDVLVWAHHDRARGLRLGPRTGGHTHTIMSIDRDAPLIHALFGNQPLPRASGSRYRFTPGRRIEAEEIISHKGGRDLEFPQPHGRVEAVWTWTSDNATTLVAAGPPRAATRPPATRREAGRLTRHLSDWLPPLRTASPATLQGRLEAAVLEARATVEAGRSTPDLAGEAALIGQAAGQRLNHLDRQAERHHRPPEKELFDDITAMLATYRRAEGSSAPRDLARALGLIADGFATTR